MAMKGDFWRKTHKMTAISLGVTGVEVESYGSAFFCTSRFTVNKFIVSLCSFAKFNGEAMPTRENIEDWVKSANSRYYVTGHGDRVSSNPKKRIVVAETPETVSTRLAMALNGGVLHESAHLLYTCQRDLTVDEMCDIVFPRWAMVKDWSKYRGMLLQWTNLVEDISIERGLRKNFVNTHTDLADLQDLILKMEGKEDENADKWRENATALAVVGGAFRDIGLGYNTTLGRKAIALYKEFPDAWNMVVAGPLTELLKEARSLDGTDDLASFRIAMSVVGLIADMAGDGSDKPEGDSGDSDKPSKYPPCPACGASPKNLVIRGVYDEYGRKDDTKALLVCTKCGHQQIIDIDKSGEGGGGSVEGETPEFEDMGDPPETDTNGGGGDGGGESSDEPADDENGGGGGESSDEPNGDDTDGDNGGGGKADNKPPVFKVGDEAMLDGTRVRVVKAGAVNADGTQDVEVEPV